MGDLCSPDLLDVTVVQWPSLEGSTSSCFLISGAESLPVASMGKTLDFATKIGSEHSLDNMGRLLFLLELAHSLDNMGRL